ncbi:MAG: trypsin-like peptidase domain-containing protein [Clostridia bacterium]|nr:trypsin-like peptidase domain-containing protein [Clostridia bacterium]
MKKTLRMILALMLALSLFSGAFAMTRDEAKEIAKGVINTETDPSLVTSPFIGVIDKIQPSVVGLNNYQTYTYSSYNPYYGFGGFGFDFGFDFGFGDFGGGYNNGSSSETVEKLAATGSGVVVYEGLVLTNFHVVEDSSRLTISTLDSEEEFECTLVTYDEAADLAVVYAPGLTLPAVPMGDSDRLQVGEWAICIGNPLMAELSGTVTAGIISALDRQIDSTTTTDKYGLKQTVTNSMIQTDAAINSGNSGGGLFNVLGQLMGIPSAKYSGSNYSGTSIEGIGLAIPINTAKPLIEEAIVSVIIGEHSADNEGLRAANTPAGRRPRLGITYDTINSSKDYLVYAGLLPTGCKIKDVEEHSPAAAAGLLPNDIIVEIEGKLATGSAVFTEVFDTCQYGDTISIKVYRVENLDEAYSTGSVKGEYIDFEVALFEYNVST